MSLITTQHVNQKKHERAKELRRQMTPAEKVLWEALRANRLSGYRFRRQQVIDGFIADFYCHALYLIIEVGGPVHNYQQAADKERNAVLAGRGLRILRFTNDEVLNTLPGVLARIKAQA